ncbi:MAG: winged helix-turn-helix transcriptional regulator [Candidatus Nitrosocaldus sp.]|nr:winged helix-turn-helix transcriptional regulator [Candidatus Nitrosocaldus sp.]MDW8275996.1 winged helix-turn-helix transcriptional regulator [Candidatus Nitrosocaldus sp.]
MGRSGRSGRLDEIDRRIMGIIYRDPDITQVKLAEKVGLTQAAISTRLSRLREMGVISRGCMIINPSDLGLELVSIDVHTEHRDAIMEKFRYCPCMVNIFCLADEDDRVGMIMAGEGRQVEYCVTKHIRRDTNITSTLVRRITNLQKGICMIADGGSRADHGEEGRKDRYDLPCNDVPCGRCEYYIDNGGACYGCPFTAFYKGRFWKDRDDDG